MMMKHAMTCLLVATVSLAPADPRPAVRPATQIATSVQQAVERLEVIIKRLDQAQLILMERSTQLLNETNQLACELAMSAHYLALTALRPIERITWKASAVAASSCEADRERACEMLRMDLSVNVSVFETVEQGFRDLPPLRNVDLVLEEQSAECSSALTEVSAVLTALSDAIGVRPTGSRSSSELTGR